MAPLLAILVPTYNRAHHVSDLLARLDAEMTDGVCVLVADNASPDETPDVLREAAATRPWLQVHRQPENLGPVGNMRWLVANAPEADYLWCFGDDDLIVPGGLAEIAALLRAERPVWLFLPHQFIDAAGTVTGGSPATGAVERFASGPDLYRAFHHWLTFLSGSIVLRAELQDAVAEVQTENMYIPLLWFFRAGLHGTAVAAPRHLVQAGQEVSWADRAHLIQTHDFTSLWDDGLKEGLSEAEFGALLDGLYGAGWGLHLWRQVPIEDLVRAATRFPQSQGLRDFLWTLAREQDRRDVLPALADAARAAGAEERARSLLADGEARFEAGDARAAIEPFAAAARLAPTLPETWNDLAVALHALGEDGLAAVDAALFAAPEDPDARHNRAVILSQG